MSGMSGWNGWQTGTRRRHLCINLLCSPTQSHTPEGDGNEHTAAAAAPARGLRLLKSPFAPSSIGFLTPLFLTATHPTAPHSPPCLPQRFLLPPLPPLFGSSPSLLSFSLFHSLAAHSLLPTWSRPSHALLHTLSLTCLAALLPWPFLYLFLSLLPPLSISHHHSPQPCPSPCSQILPRPVSAVPTAAGSRHRRGVDLTPIP